MLEEFGAVQNDATLVDINGVGGERLVPELTIAGRDCIQQCLIPGAEQCG